jgi:predicted ATPase/DNA-binding XRE family transcriptional regulator
MDIEAERGSFGLVLRRLRLEAGMSQEELADRAHLSAESIGALERGRRRAPYRETVRLISDALVLCAEARRELEAAAKRPRAGTANAIAYDSTDAAELTPRGAERPRHNLVRPLSTFHNRRRELSDLAQLLETYRLISLVGAGGIGKTRLALELAARLLERYRDGVWFIDLAPLSDLGVVARSVIATLAIPQNDSQSELETLVHHLERREVLLVIDNCEHVVQQVAALTGALLPACVNLRVLSTSREPLNVDGERVYRLPPLESPSADADLSAEKSLAFAAVSLFVDRSTAANAAFVYTDTLAGTVAETCRRLDGIALAIELAASRTAVLTPQQILGQLEDHFHILAGGNRSALPRQRTMRETIRWSYDRLDAEERSLFRRVAVFVGGFTLEAAQALVGASATGPATLDVLTSLVDKSLVSADLSGAVTRHRLLQPMRAYGMEMLEEAGELRAMRGRFAGWCLSFVRSAHEAWATVSSTSWSAQVKPEMDNVRAGLLWTLEERNDVELGQRIAAGARRIWSRLFPYEGRRWIAAARQLVTRETPAEVTVGLALAHANLFTVLREFSAALAAADACENTVLAEIDELALAEARGFAGFALSQLGETVEGEKRMAASIDVFRMRGAKQLTAYGMISFAIAHSSRGDLLEARRLFREALTILRETRNESAAASVAVNLAELEFSAGDPEGALRLCAEALAALGNEREARVCLANMAAYLVRLERFDEARDRARESLRCGGIVQSDLDVAFALQHLAAVAALRGSLEAQTRAHEFTRAARLLGFVDARYAAFAGAREFTEQHEYDAVIGRLTSELGSAALNESLNSGKLWSEDEALREAFKI